MKDTKAISIYKQFSCAQGKCEYTCCRDWQIALDEETEKRYKALRGPKGFLTRAIYLKKKDGIMRMRVFRNRCLHFTRDGKCGLQLAGKCEYMPVICHIYPRKSFLFTGCEEILLDLSCIEVSRLFVNNPGRLSFEAIDNGIPVFWDMKNADPILVDFLTRKREMLLDFWWSEALSFNNRIATIYTYTHKVQRKLAEDKLSEADLIELNAKDNDLMDISVTVLLEIIERRLEQRRQQSNHKEACLLCSKIINLYNDCQSNNDSFSQKIEETLEKCPLINDVINSYFSYQIQWRVMESCEDYYLLGPMIMNIFMSKLMLYTLCADYIYNTDFYETNNSLSTKDHIAWIITYIECSFGHNMSLDKLILNEIRATF